MKKQQTLNNFFKPSSAIMLTNILRKRNSDDADDGSIIPTPPKIRHVDGLEIAEEIAEPPIHLNDIGLFINCDLKDVDKSLVSKLLYSFIFYTFLYE